MHYESAFLQLVLRPKAALTDVFVALDTGVGQQESSTEYDEDNANDHDSAAKRGEIEQCERFVPAQHHGFTYQEVRRCSDQCHQAAEQGRVGERH